MEAVDGPPLFAQRVECIACGSSDLRKLSGADFEENPVHSFISDDPWGESPIPYLRGEEWEYVKCRQCDQMFHKRIIAPEWEHTLFTKWMTKEAIEEFEERIGARSANSKFEKARMLTRHVLRLEDLTASLRRGEIMRVMDFGCGWGEFIYIASHYGAEAYGIDADPDRLGVARNKEIQVRSSLAELAPELKGKLHVITLFQVLEHLPKPLSTLHEMASWLMPGGILILETPDCSGVSNIKTAEDYRAINPLSHINAFTPATLRAIAQNAGFYPIFSGVAHATTSPVQVIKTEIKRMIGRLLPATTNQYFRRK